MDDQRRCDCCHKVPDVDPVTDEYDLNQMCHWPMVYRNGQLETVWACSACAGIPKFGIVPCPDEFLNVDGTCQVCS